MHDGQVIAIQSPFHDAAGRQQGIRMLCRQQPVLSGLFDPRQQSAAQRRVVAQQAFGGEADGSPVHPGDHRASLSVDAVGYILLAGRVPREPPEHRRADAARQHDDGLARQIGHRRLDGHAVAVEVRQEGQLLPTKGYAVKIAVQRVRAESLRVLMDAQQVSVIDVDGHVLVVPDQLPRGLAEAVPLQRRADEPFIHPGLHSSHNRAGSRSTARLAFTW